MSPMRSNVLALILIMSSRTLAQNSGPPFFWGFDAGTTEFTNHQLTSCATLTVMVFTNPDNVQPLNAPFTMVVFQPAGPVVASPLSGRDLSNLQWVVPYPSGSSLLLQVVDKNGVSGGIAESVFTVTAGSSTNCISHTNPSVQISTSNTSLNTCDSLLLDISGGTKPYTVSIVPLGRNSPINITLGPDDDELEWIDRVAPGTQILATAQDSTGQISIATSLINLSGSDDTTCTGKSDQTRKKGSLSSSGSSTGGSTQTTSTPDHNTSKKGSSNTGAIAGGAAAGAVVLVALAALAMLFCLRRRRRRNAYQPGQKPDMFGVADESFGTRSGHQPTIGNDRPGGAVPSWNEHGTNAYVFRDYPLAQNSTSATPTTSNSQIPLRYHDDLPDRLPSPTHLPYHRHTQSSSSVGSPPLSPGYGQYDDPQYRASATTTFSGYSSGALSYQSGGSAIPFASQQSNPRSGLVQPPAVPASVAYALNRTMSPGPSSTGRKSAEHKGAGALQVLQHSDAGAAQVEEIPPAYEDRSSRK